MRYLQTKFEGKSNGRYIEFQNNLIERNEFIKNLNLGKIRNSNNIEPYQELLNIIKIMYPNYAFDNDVNYDEQFNINIETFIIYASEKILLNNQLHYYNHKDYYHNIKENIEVLVF